MSKPFMGYKKEDILKECEKELTLKDIQVRLFQMMEAFDDFCRSKELNYCIAYGTLIGAVRHKGFIPWDDDVDFYMPREDYEKLMKFDKITDDFLLININRQGSYYYPYAFGNIVDKKTMMVPNNMDICTGKGLSIDILPVDLVPDDISTRKSFVKEILRYRRIVDLMHGRRFNNKGIKFTLKRWIARVMAFLLDEEKYVKKIDSVAKRYIGTDNVSSIQLMLVVPKVFPISVFTNPIELEFNGKMFYAPSNYDTMLSEIYGDYMTPPPVKDRYNHNMRVFWKKV